MREACRNIGRRIRNTNSMSTNEFFGFSLLVVSILSLLMGIVIDLCAIFE